MAEPAVQYDEMVQSLEDEGVARFDAGRDRRGEQPDHTLGAAPASAEPEN
ncbi:hypothetical protein KGA66_19100 [Actinocrinis puniceicyclus]|uniref:Uncharacterized protein n=1 Tax=Actinocrinis puniceicyclus TaxID=977794 RepID=A0A8J8BEG4_9ACTN|nr:hypothetical protein [Actinocrinis puniceicyclus]MBS2965166.1 hypothetical protein [Actinocrinis puniceicyclus]